ncbi:MAG: NADH-quinone oxidoreductase subunit H [Planctomycetes bacterium]|nr:NADH-quinone oxidoreductase subunit H [Planctomycetota bacterium]
MKEFIEHLYNELEFLEGLPFIIPFIIGSFILAFIIINFIAVFAGVCTYIERKVAARIQARVGPYMVGPHGILQWLADALKLLFKEDTVPEKADKLLFKLAPFIVFAGSFACWVALPLAPAFSPARLNIGILYIIAFGSSVILGILMAGWASSSKWALFGAMRSAAQIVSYEVPTGLTILAMLLITGTLDMHNTIAQINLDGTISGGQSQGLPFPLNYFSTNADNFSAGMFSWYIFRYPPFTFIAFIIIYICALAETNRVPFDIPEAESELVSGYHTEYSGMRFSFFFLSEYANMFVFSAIITTLFLGGWLPPFNITGSLLAPACGIILYMLVKGKTTDPANRFIAFCTGAGIGIFLGVLSGDKNYWFADYLGIQSLRFIEGLFWFFTKSFGLVILMMWLRWTIPRYRVDQLMELCWKKLTPLAFINLFCIGILEWLYK